MRIALVVAILLASCVKSSSVECGDGRVCPEGRLCAAITNPEELLCVLPQQIEDCVGKQPFDPCGTTGGRCYDGVCLPAGCGNARTDPDEVCDDGNGNVGDGCTPDCLSNETCGNGHTDSVKEELCDLGDVLGRDGCTSVCTLEEVEWQLVVPSGAGLNRPRGRWQSAMAYDIARGKAVLFGGRRGPNSNGTGTEDAETWEWGGRGWVQRFPVPSPSPRHGHVMAYDEARGRIVMFGGEGTDASTNEVQQVFQDTWEWDGEQWIAIPPQGAVPRGRAHHALVYDPVRKGVVLVGGDDATANPPELLDDTWIWDGATWTPVQTTGKPAGGGYASIAFDPIAGAITYAAPGTSTATWRLAGTTWTQLAATGALPRSGMIWDTRGQRMIAFGGDVNGSAQTSVRAFDGTAWSTIGTMGAREQFAIAGDVDRRVAVLSGGSDATGAVLLDTSEWSTTAVAAVPASGSPAVRARPAAATSTGRGSMVLFGGIVTGSAVDETWELDRDGWHLLAGIGTPPSARHSSAMTYDAARGQVVLFGGETSANALLGDTWVFDDATATWTQKVPATSPPARFNHAMAYDAARGRVVMFGGVIQLAPLQTEGDTWEWDGTNWTKVATTGPAARFLHMMSYDPIRQRVVLTGAGPTQSPADVWEWDGTMWTDVSPASGPIPRKVLGGLAWDAARGRTVLWGGLPLDDVIWEWDGTMWTGLAADGPTARTGHRLVADPRGAGVILYGGDDVAMQQNDTWRLSYRGDEPYESCRAPIDLDGDARAGCDDLDCWATCAPRCPPGAVCDPVVARCGDGTCNPALEIHRACAADCPATPACGDAICEGGETATTCPGDCS